MNEGETTLYEQGGIRITSSAVFVRDRRIPRDEIASVDVVRVSRSERTLAVFAFAAAGALGTYATLRLVFDGFSRGPEAMTLLYVVALVVAAAGIAWYRAFPDPLTVALRSKSERLTLMTARTEAEVRPLRAALAGAIPNRTPVAAP